MSPRARLLEHAAPVLYWLMLVVALVILLRGHHHPGGGFIGGLIAVAASAQLALILGVEAARRRLPIDPARLAALGVGLALLAGVPALLAGEAFLDHQRLGPLNTVLLFDLGVFLAVWGTLNGYVQALLEAPPS